MTKRQQMKIACCFAGISIHKYAKSIGVTATAVHHVLNGKPAKMLSKQVDSFIATQFEKYHLTEGKNHRSAA
jgi:hypothetical protein